MMSSAWRTDTVATERSVPVWLGLGTNLGDRAAHLGSAVRALRRLVIVEQLSGIYETQPFGYTDQPVFWNMVLRVRTGMNPWQLLSALKALEPALGRVASFHMGPRAIDIDILLYGDERVSSAALTIPHAGLLERAFVLQPLAEIEPLLRHPVSGGTILDHARAAGTQGVRRIGAAIDVLPLEEEER